MNAVQETVAACIIFTEMLMVDWKLVLLPKASSCGY